jgi:hypothetical protein
MIKRLILAFLLLTAPAWAGERFNSQCRTDDGPISNGCTVTVYDQGTVNVSTIWSDSALTVAKANPFTADADGRFFFYAADARYDVQVAGGTPTVGTETISDVLLGDTSGGFGTVSSVALAVPAEWTVSGSPITGSGTITISEATQTANTVYAGPTSGGAAAPGFRALVDADIPNLGTLATGLTASRCVETDGSGLLTVAASTCSTTSGTVTSVAMTVPSILSVAGSPITASGTLAVTLASQSANTVFAAPDGAGGTPTFRSLVADDIPSLATSKVTSGTFADARIAASNVTQHEASLTLGNLGGTLGVTKGGTGLTALTLGDIYYASAANTLARLSGNTSATKMYLSQTGTGASSAAPVWGAIQAADLPTLIDAAKIADGTVSNTEFQYLNGVTSALQTQLAARALTTTTLTAGVGLSGGGDLSTNRTFTLDLTEIDSTTFSDGTQASFTHTFDVNTGVDPVWTASAGVLNLTAGALQVAGNAVLTSASTHSLLSATHGDTLAAAVTRGSIIVGNATPAWSELVVGTANQVLATDGTDAAWTTLAKANLPAAIAYEDEANTFTALQTLDSTGIKWPATGAAPSYAEGQVYYDQDEGAWAGFNDEADLVVRVGQEVYVRVKNESLGTISKGEPVYITGADTGGTIFPTVDQADSDAIATADVLGFAAHSIEDATYGYVIVQGILRGVNTSSFTAGDSLWISSTAGGLVNARPLAPQFVSHVGHVTTSHASTGSIKVEIDPAFEGAPRGAMYASATGTAAITAGTDLKLGGTCTISGIEQEFTESAECRLRYDGADTREFLVTVHGSFTSSASNVILDLEIAENGTVNTNTVQQEKFGTGTDVISFSTSWVFELATNDYIEAWADIDSGTSTITTEKLIVDVTAID